MKYYSKNNLLFLLWSSFMVYMLLYIINLRWGESYLINYDLMMTSSMTMSLTMIADSVSLSFGWVVTFISSAVFFFASYYMHEDLYYKRFMLILFSFVISMNLLIFAGSMFMLMVGWDGLGITSFALIVYYQSSNSASAGFLTLMINRLGDVLIMSMMSLMVVLGYTTLMFMKDNYAVTVIVSVLGIAALTKSAQYPFSSWLPEAMAAPTPVSALVHSSTLVTAGVYLMIRIMMNTSASSEISSLLLFCGAMTSLVGGSCAVYENDLKKIIALSTLSQLGIMVFSLGMGSYVLALFHLYTHAMFKALLFVVAGALLMMTYGVQDIRLIGSVCQFNPLLMVFMNSSAFCLVGVPFMSAYYSKHMILTLMLSGMINIIAVIIMLVSIGITVVYTTRLLKSLNWNNLSMSVINIQEFSFMFYLPMIMLMVASLLLGSVLTWIDIYTNYYVTSTNLNYLINFMLFMGLFFGLFMMKRKRSMVFNTMFFMSPVFSKVLPFNYFYLSGCIKSLDLGWLEPQNYQFMMTSSFKPSLNMWPLHKTVSFSHYFIISFIFMLWLWFLLKL